MWNLKLGELVRLVDVLSMSTKWRTGAHSMQSHFYGKQEVSLVGMQNALSKGPFRQGKLTIYSCTLLQITCKSFQIESNFQCEANRQKQGDEA